jgi:hypothetical protein
VPTKKKAAPTKAEAAPKKAAPPPACAAQVTFTWTPDTAAPLTVAFVFEDGYTCATWDQAATHAIDQLRG